MPTVRPDAQSRAIACLAIPSLAFACEMTERPSLAGTPVALSDEARVRVVEVTQEARRHGVRAGMTLLNAVGLCPTLTILEPRPALVTRLAEALVEAMCAVSPLVEEAEPGVVFADLRGTEGIYPRLEDLRDAVFAGIPEGLHPQLGVAGHRFTAWVAASRTEPGTLRHVAVEDAAAFLAPRAVSWLPFDVEVIARLRLLGIATCGQFAALPRHAVEAQFGFPAGLAWLAAHGEDPTSIHPRPWEQERVVEVAEAEPPLVSREAILHALDQMLGRALRQPRVVPENATIDTPTGAIAPPENVPAEAELVVAVSAMPLAASAGAPPAAQVTVCSAGTPSIVNDTTSFSFGAQAAVEAIVISQLPAALTVTPEPHDRPAIPAAMVAPGLWPTP